MKTNFKRVSTKSLSVLIALVIVMSTMLVGIIAVNAAAAADATANSTISFWTVSGYQKDGGLASVDWSASNETYKISGASGSVTYTNNSNTNAIYFRMLAHMSDNSKYVASLGDNKETQTTLTNGVKSAALKWTLCPSNYTKIDSIDGQLVFKPTKKYVTFTMSQSGLNNYVTVTESDYPDFYIGGRFKAKDASGNDVDCYTGTTYEWDAASKKFKFTETDTAGLFKFETNSTLTQLSRKSAKDQYPFFLIHTGSGDGDGNTWYGGSNSNLHNFQNNNESKQATLTKYTDGNTEAKLIKFSATADNPAGKVTLYLDARNNAVKLYYKTDSPEPTTQPTTAPQNHNITIDYDPNATANCSSGSAPKGETIKVTITTKNNYTCSDIQVNGVSQTVTANGNVYTCSFTMPDEDVNITYTLNAPSAAITDVLLTSSNTSVMPGEEFTLTASLIPSDAVANTYEFYQITGDISSLYQEDVYSSGVSLGAPQKSPTFRVTAPEGVDIYNYYVVVTDASGNTFRSIFVKVPVIEASTAHDVTVYFKSSSSYVYVPSVSVDGGAFTEMTQYEELGTTASGALKFYWFEYTIPGVDSTKDHTLVFKTRATDLYASITDRLLDDICYFAVDNLMESSTAVNVTSEPEYIRNYHNTALNMLAPANPDTGTLGYTCVMWTRYQMGSYISDNPFADPYVSIKSATLIQKTLVKLASPSELQSQLLDVDLNGRMSIKDATLIQKALVH